MNHAEWIIVLCALFAVLHGLTGFGFPIMSTALLSSVYSLDIAVTMTIFPCLILNIYILKTSIGQHFVSTLKSYLLQFLPFIYSSFIGSFIGVGLLYLIPDVYLKFVLSIVIILYVIDQFRKNSFRIQSSKQNMIIFGLLAGILGGAINAMAPFLMMYLLSNDLNKKEILIVSNFSFLISKVVQFILLAPVLIQLQLNDLSIIFYISILTLFGAYWGQKLHHKLSPQHFKKIALLMLAGLGGYILWQSLITL